MRMTSKPTDRHRTPLRSVQRHGPAVAQTGQAPTVRPVNGRRGQRSAAERRLRRGSFDVTDIDVSPATASADESDEGGATVAASPSRGPNHDHSLLVQEGDIAADY